MRLISTYDRFELLSMSLEHVATVLNFRNNVTDEKAMYRSAFGELFEVHVFSGGGANLWSPTGTSLGQQQCTSSADLVGWLEERTGAWLRGFVHCSDCDSPMRRFSEDTAGLYFAGVYCSKCWNERGWKEKAANETYD